MMQETITIEPGLTWQAPDGEASVLSAHVDGRFWVSVPDMPAGYAELMDADTVRAIMRRDASNIASDKRTADAQAAKQAATDKKERNLSAFLATITTPMRRGRVEKTLRTLTRYNRSIIATRWELMQSLVSKGYKVECDGTLVSPEDYIVIVPKACTDFVAFLIEKG